MPRTARFAERIGKVFLPEADTIDTSQDFTPNPEGPFPDPGLPFPREPFPMPREPRLPIKWPPELIDPFFPRFCFTSLKQGCYTLSFVPNGISILSTRYRGTLRVESVGSGLRISGDLYRYRLLDDLVIASPIEAVRVAEPIRGLFARDDAEDTGGTIPIYPRRRYHSYLKGTGAQLFSIKPRGAPCSFTLNFDEFVYNHPATGFSGTFNTTKTRSIRFVLKHTSTPDYYEGEAFEGTTLLGKVSIRCISDRFRRAHLQINTLQGAVTPPAVGSTTFATIFTGTGWDLTVTDGGTITLPGALSGVNINTCWSSANLHTLMSSVPGYNAADLDSVWRVHLVAVPATLGCSRGIMFDSGGADANAVGREGSATFSHDGYPASEVPDGMGGSHYDGAAGDQQRNVPRAYLRSATHEVGHAFNQIHQNFEGGSDNSIMTPTPGVATVIGTGGTFPDAINLSFNATVRRHLNHLPDPAVRPGAMNFFGSAISAPEASDVAWLEPLVATIGLSSDHVVLGEPVGLTLDLTNTGEVALPVPEALDLESLTVRVNVTDPAGRITFMRPETIHSCPRTRLVALAPGESMKMKAAAEVFWGQEGFAFETPGRHVVEVIVLWHIGDVPVATAAERDVFVAYPVSDTDNEMAALLLHPVVGRAVATRRVSRVEEAARRIRQAMSIGRNHPAVRALNNLGLLTAPPPPTPGGAPTGRKRAAKGGRRPTTASRAGRAPTARRRSAKTGRRR